MDIISLNELITQDLDVLNEQIAFHKKRSQTAKEAFRKKIHSETALKLALIADHIAKLLSALAEAQNRPKPVKLGNQLTLSYDEIKGLPQELLEELSIDSNSPDYTIIDLIEESGEILSLDKILVGLYKKTGEIHKRSQLNNRLYRMVQRGELFSVAGKKGVYSTRELTDDEVENILSYKPHLDKSVEDLL